MCDCIGKLSSLPTRDATDKNSEIKDVELRKHQMEQWTKKAPHIEDNLLGVDPRLAKEIFDAAEKDSVDVFESLLKDVKDVNFTMGAYANATPLHWAAIHGQKEIVKWICERRSERNINAKDNFGFTPLHLAMFSASKENAQLKEVVDELLKVDDIDVTAVADGRKCTISFVPCGENVARKLTRSRMTPLHLAAVFGPPISVPKAVIDDLLKPSRWHDQSPVTFRTNEGETPLHLAAMTGSRYDVIEVLLEHMKFYNIPETVDDKWQTPLHLAVKAQKVNPMTLLLKKGGGSKLNERDWDGNTPLELARKITMNMRKENSKSQLLTGCTRWLESFRIFIHHIQSSCGRKATSGSLLDRSSKPAHPQTWEKILDLFELHDREYLQNSKKLYVDTANTILVGAALIASASFGAWLQPPLGYSPYYKDEFLVQAPVAPPGTYESYVPINQHWTIQLFWIFNSLSFFFSIATIIAGLDAALPRRRLTLKQAADNGRRKVIYASYMLFMAIIGIVGTFISCGFSILPPIPKYTVSMYITSVIGIAVCIIVCYKFISPRVAAWFHEPVET